MKMLVMLTISALVLSGCATLSKDECLTANWYQIGYEDGAEGYPDTRIKSHREACAEYGIKPNFNDFQKGHGEGVITFCTPRNGFNKGKRNTKYQGVCPVDLETNFLEAYNNGRQIHAANTAVRDAKSAQRRNKQEQESLQQGILDKKAIMFAAGTTTETRYALDAEVTQMQRSLNSLEIQKRQLNNDVIRTERKLSELESEFAFSY